MSNAAVADLPTREQQLLLGDQRAAVEAERSLAQALIARLEDELPAALRGSRLSVREYVSTWRDLKVVVLDAIRRVRPDRVGVVGSRVLLCDASGAPSSIADEALDLTAIRAPLSAWVDTYGLGTGTAVALLAEIRAYLPDVPTLEPPSNATFPRIEVDRTGLEHFARLVLDELAARKAPLERVMEIFDLSLTDLGRLFGVSRQAAQQWIDEGVPPQRMGKLAAVLATAELLEYKLRAGRVPLAARRPADAYGGRTMFEMIEADQHEELSRSVRTSFDWSGTA